MKKLLILVMLFSMGLAGIASAEVGKMIYYRWDNGNTATTIQGYQRDFSTAPTSIDWAYVPSPANLSTPGWENGGNYAGRFEGFIIPPETGNYIFNVASDDASEFWLSNSEDPTKAIRICYVSGWTNDNEWTKEGNQTSASIALVKDKPCFFYAVWKEGGGGDGCAVAWMNNVSIKTRVKVPLANVSNAFPIASAPKPMAKSTYPIPAAVEYDLWDPASNGDVSVYGVINGIMPDFSTLPAPTSTGLVGPFGVGIMAGTDDFIYRQYGIIKVDAAADLQFGTSSDDGSKLYVGNWWESGPLTLVVNNDGWHGMQWRFGTIAVPAGYLGVVVEMYEDGGGEGLEVGYCSATIPWHTITSNELYSRKYACRPSPTNGATVPVGTVLSWTMPVFKATATNAVYFAEAGQALVKVQEGAATSYTPTLAIGKGYEWRVDILEPNLAGPKPIVTTGQVWAFNSQPVAAEKKLVGYWPLDTDLADASGNLIAGKYNSNDASAPVFEPGMKGNALAVNIANTTNLQYVKLADVDVATLSPTGIQGNTPRTIACWAKNGVPVGDIGDWCTVFGFTNPGSGISEYSFDINKSWGNWYLIHRYGGEWGMRTIDDQWHYLVATYEPAASIWSTVANGTVKWYVDGVFGGSAATNLQTRDVLHIGKRAHSDTLWRGWVDEARLYNYALSDAEVLQLFFDSGGTSACLGTTYPAYDFNKNCVVDTADLILFAEGWLQDNLIN